MDPIFDREGRNVAWRKRDELFDCEGRQTGLIRERAVFGLDGSHRGWFLDGFYRDRDGRCVGFEEGATGGPLLPPATEAGLAPQPQPGRPAPAVKAPPALSMKPRAWSEVSWRAWMAGVRRTSVARRA